MVVVKPDGVQHRLIGRIVSRFEEAGLRVAEMRMLTPTRELIERHYPSTMEWFADVGGKTIGDYDRRGQDVEADLGTVDPVEIGRMVKGWLVDFMSGGPVVAMVLEGPDVVAEVRSLVGDTLPLEADPGTIRGDFGFDSPGAANAERRPVHNLVHASSDDSEAAREVALWFPD